MSHHRPVKTAQDIHQRGFTRAGLAHNRNKFTFFYRQVYIFKADYFDRPRIIYLTEIDNLNQLVCIYLWKLGFAVQPLPDSGLEFSSVNHCLCLPYSAPSLCERLPAKLYSSLYFSSERHRHPFRESCRRCHNHHSLRQCAFFHGIHLHGKITLHSRRNRNHMYRII